MVSVIVPNYNYARFLDERMRSILSQTYQNFEIIILDDCSTDNSREVIEKYRNNPKVREIVVNEKNSGSPFKQWDKGIKLAKGELVWIAEADDSCMPTFLEELIQGYTLNPQCTLMFSLFLLINEEGKITGGQSREGGRVMIKGERFIRDFLSTGNFIGNVSMTIFSKKAAMQVNPGYTEYKGGGDWLFYIRLAELGNVFFVRKHLDLYRRHSGTVTSRVVSSGLEPKEDKEIYDYMREKGYISSLSAIAVRAIHREKTIKAKYDTKEIKFQSYKMWGGTKYNRMTTRITISIYCQWERLIRRIDEILFKI